MRGRPVLVGGALTGVGLLGLAVSAAILVPGIATAGDWGPAPLLGAGVGVLLMLVGVGMIRDRQLVPARRAGRHGTGPAWFPGTPTHSGTDGADFSFDWSGGDCGGGGDGGGGGDCGGGGGGS
ncbi:hypothetical protein ACGFI9_34200 [Micromonospora sp. NPDC048930]|uniref:hypothetical protein n=1 Tax=Micromonospora sp. NPDC048930 TaxID=3364261 RepID=UPI0037113853